VNLLVTGGAGYIGSVVTARLVEDGHDVTVLDDLSKGHADAISPAARFIHGRIQEADVALEAGRIDVVIHLAAYSLVAESVADPRRYIENNVAGTEALLDAMGRHGVDKIIFSSTAAVYGDPRSVPIEETAEETPVNPYGQSKLLVDRELERRAGEGRLGAISLRYFNVAGAFGGLGERHSPETHLVPLALDVAAGRRDSLVVYGEDYPTPDGTCVRDYIHVADIAEAHLAALAVLETGHYEKVNLGNGQGFSVRRVIDAVKAVTGRDLPLEVGPRRPGDPAVLVASAGRARERLGWLPSRPDIETMVADAWAVARGNGP
jgi:UDP-glucose 4-epimerase